MGKALVTSSQSLREDPVLKDMNLVEAVKLIRSQPCDSTMDDLMGMRCFE